VGGTHEIDTRDSTFSEGGVAFGGDQPSFNNLKIGHDNNSDGDLADGGDDLLVDEDFESASAAFTYDHAGNLVDDGHLVYYYDPPALIPSPRLVTGERGGPQEPRPARL